MVEYFIGGINVIDRDSLKSLAKDAVFNCRSAVEYGVGCGANFETILAANEVRYINEKNKTIYKDFGEMLFTHFGVSGPLVLSASSHMKDIKPRKYEIHIDLKPALSYEQLDKRIQRDFLENSNKNFINALDALLPKKLVPVIVKLSGIKPAVKVNQITKQQRSELVNLLKDLKVTVNGFRPIEEAIVTSGGVSVKEIDPKTMESKLCKGLYFAGEVIDVDAYTGGFNLQIAFSTGKLAGSSI